MAPPRLARPISCRQRGAPAGRRLAIAISPRRVTARVGPAPPMPRRRPARSVERLRASATWPSRAMAPPTRVPSIWGRLKEPPAVRRRRALASYRASARVAPARSAKSNSSRPMSSAGRPQGLAMRRRCAAVTLPSAPTTSCWRPARCARGASPARAATLTMSATERRPSARRSWPTTAPNARPAKARAAPAATVSAFLPVKAARARAVAALAVARAATAAPVGTAAQPAMAPLPQVARRPPVAVTRPVVARAAVAASRPLAKRAARAASALPNEDRRGAPCCWAWPLWRQR